MQEIGIAILGFGTVGAGVVHAIAENEALITARTGLKVSVKKIADLDITSDRGVTVDAGCLTTDASAAINDPEVHVVVETIGGTTIAKKFMLEALNAGKSVVTANKALLAEHGTEMYAAAEASGADLLYEASVAGGIPIIKSLREGLVGNRIESVFGIMNGTCNYILTRMENEGIAFDEVLDEAQKAGYAEAEPSLDIDGFDTAHKAAIIASLAFGKTFEFDDIYVAGIRGLDTRDVDYAAELGYRMKLLAVIRNSDPASDCDAVQVRVQPTLIPRDHMLANVSGAFNAVLVRGDTVGETLYYGQGAGRFPTASAVISDIIDAARNVAMDCRGRVHAMPTNGAGVLADIGSTVVRYYLRLNLKDNPGVLGKVTQVLGAQNISLASVIQKSTEAGDFVPVVFLTQECKVADMDAALERLTGMPEVADEVVRMIVEDLA